MRKTRIWLLPWNEYKIILTLFISVDQLNRFVVQMHQMLNNIVLLFL